MVLTTTCRCLLSVFYLIHKLKRSDFSNLSPYFWRNRALLGGLLGSGIIKEGNPLSVHFVMFVPTILGQGTTDQQAEWLGRAWNLEILGTYAQVHILQSDFSHFMISYLHHICRCRPNLAMVHLLEA